jgi:aspartate-semialdehyde dehydrogenase
LTRRDARIALVGATGTVGSQIAELIGERNFPYSELKLFARDSAGRMVEVGERSLPVATFSGVQDLSGFDIAFLAIPADASTALIDAKPGPVLIDLSAATLPPHDEAALVAPGLTARQRIVQSGAGQVFAVPHPAAHLISEILQVVDDHTFASASIMLSASADGHQGISELFQQSADLLNARLELDEEPQVAFNAFASGARELARAFTAQIRAMGAKTGQLLLDIVRVPTFHGTGVTLFLPADPTKPEWTERLRSAQGLILVSNEDGAGLVDAVGQDGAITRISMDDAGAVIWCAFDSARLAALTAVWIAETLSAEPVST